MNTGQATVQKAGSGAVIVLGSICVVSALTLSLVYSSLKTAIARKEREAENCGLEVVLGKADSYPLVDKNAAEGDEVYVAQSDSEVLYAAAGRTQGYQSPVVVIVSVAVPRPEEFELGDAATYPAVPDDPEIHSLAVVSSQETPGLGENIKLIEKDISIWARLAGRRGGPPRRPAFQRQFGGMKLSDLGHEKERPLGEVHAITGATMTSAAVTAAARDAIRKILESKGGKPSTK